LLVGDYYRRKMKRGVDIKKKKGGEGRKAIWGIK